MRSQWMHALQPQVLQPGPLWISRKHAGVQIAVSVENGRVPPFDEGDKPRDFVGHLAALSDRALSKKAFCLPKNVRM
jgi:hypothetical protein